MGDPIVQWLEGTTRPLAHFLALVAAVSAVVLTVVVTYGVFMRFVLNDAQNWTDELASYCMLWMVFFGLAYTLATGAHIRVDFFSGLLRDRSRLIAELVVWVIGAMFALLLFLGCLSAVENFIRRGTHSTAGLDIPLFWPAMPLLIGSAVFGLIMILRVLQIATSGVLPTEDEP